MKRVIKIVVIILILLTGAFYYYGGFDSIVFSKSIQGGETIVYQEMKGAYSQTPKVMDEVYYYLLDQEIQSYKGIGIYLDSPKKVEEAELRSEIGCIIEPQDIEKLSELTKYSIKILDEKEYIVATFPYKGFPAVFIGMRKAYPALEKYVQENNYQGGAVIEIYDDKSKTISYRQEILEN